MSLFGWLFLAIPTGAEDAATGSVQFEIVDAVTGDPLEAQVESDFGTVLTRADDPDIVSDVPVGEQTYYIASGRYGNTPGRGGLPGHTVNVQVVENVETFVRVEMLPPGKVRFQAITEVTDDPLTEVNAWTNTRVVGQIGDRITATDGWFEIDVFPAPVENIIVVFDTDGFFSYDLPIVASGEVVSLTEPLVVPIVNSVQGTVLDPDGNPVEGALVAASQNGSINLASDQWMETGPDGSFYLSGRSVWKTVVAFPPDGRPDLAAGGPEPGGLRGLEWAGGVRHPTVEITLPRGKWLPYDGTRSAPTEANPITFASSGTPSRTRGVNILTYGSTSDDTWTEIGYELQGFNGAPRGLFDIHPSLAPKDGDHPTLAPFGADPFTCALTIDCSVYRTRGPFGEQLVVGFQSPTSRSWTLHYGPGEDGLVVDPPLISGVSYDGDPQTVDIATVYGCPVALQAERTQNDPHITYSVDASDEAPGTATFDGRIDSYLVQLSAGGETGVLLYSVAPGPGTVPNYKIGGVLPATCDPSPPVTTTTTTTTSTSTTSTSTSTTTVPTTTTTSPPTGSTSSTTTSTTSSTTTTSNPTTTSTPAISTSTTGVPVTVAATTPTTSPPTTVPKSPSGYVVSTLRGSVFAFGELEKAGDADAIEVVAIALHPSGGGYWILEASGEVHAFGDAQDFGRLIAADFGSDRRAATMAATPSGSGYWLITNNGRAFAFGDAVHHGDLAAFTLAGDVIGAAGTPSGDGYYLVGSDGGIFSFGDAAFAGSIPQVLPGVELAAPIVGLTPDPDGAGYWLVAADGGVFGFDAPFRGSIPGVLPPGATLVAPINGMVPFGSGYLLVAGDGGVFNFSNLPFLGSLGDTELDSPIVAISAT